MATRSSWSAKSGRAACVEPALRSGERARYTAGAMHRTGPLFHGVLCVCLLLSSLRAAAEPSDPAAPDQAPASAVPAAGSAAPAEASTAPAPSTPGSVAPPPEPNPTGAVQRAALPAQGVRFLETHGGQVSLFERKAGKWLSVCTSPCSFPAPDGPRDFGAPAKLGPASDRLRVAAEGLWLASGDGLQAELRDRRVVRRVGAGLVVAGLLTFFVPIIAGGKNDAVMAGVATSGAALTLGGAVMLLMKDRVKLTRCVGCYPAGR